VLQEFAVIITYDILSFYLTSCDSFLRSAKRVLAIVILSVCLFVRPSVTANIDNLERPLTPSKFFVTSGCDTHSKSELRRNHWR